MKKVISSLCFLCACAAALGQNYHAVQGSSYAGSLGIANNPSSMLSTPYHWDLTLAGAQFKSSTNIITIHDFSLLSPSKKSSYSINEGDFERKARVSFNVNLLNARIGLDRRTTIGFGLNVRGIGRVRSDPFNFDDSIKNVRDFF